MPVTTTVAATTMVVVTTQVPQQTTTAPTQAPATGGMNITMPVVTAAHMSTEAPSMFKFYNQR